jgi:membrane protein required for colicin V production
MDLAHLDWIIIGVLSLSTLLSIFRGFVREALALGSWVIAIIVARWFVDPLSAMLAPVISQSAIRMLVAYGVLILGTLIFCGLLTRLLGALIKVSGLSTMDRILGMIFGFLRGCLLVLLGVMALYYWTSVASGSAWQSSVLVPYVLEAMEWLKPLVLEQSGQLIQNLKEA